MAETITKEMSIQEIVSNNPEVVEVLAQFGLGCIGCAMASYETLEQGAMAHGIDADDLVKAINEKLSGKADKPGGCCGCGS